MVCFECPLCVTGGRPDVASERPTPPRDGRACELGPVPGRVSGVRIPAGGDGEPGAGLVSSPVTAARGMTPSTIDAPAVLALFEDARRGAELLGRALAE
ncbi:hypothetical protein U1Q18_037080 [Sarracenia purpurea var. burkii]